MCRRPGQKGQGQGQAARTLARRLHHENPRKSDASGDIIAFDLTGGEASDGASLRNPARHRDPTSSLSAAISRQRLRQQGQPRGGKGARRRAGPPAHKANEKDKPAFFARTLYKARARIEQGVGRLKRFKRVALRCEKTERNFRSIVSFAPQASAWSQIRPHSPR